MKPITIIANWKMQLTLHESIALAEQIERGLPELPAWLRVILCPAFTALPSLQPILRTCLLGAQDMFWENRGAYTGEVSARMLTELGCRLVILGHSERREYLRETDDMVQKKIRAALAAHMTPIICVGETMEEREQGMKEAVIDGQVQRAFAGVDIGASGNILIAYEPRWAIGTGHIVASADVAHMSEVILHAFRNVYPGHSLDTRVQVLYGGSVDRGNARAFLEASIGGFLVGTASKRAEDFLPIIESVLHNTLT